MKTIKRAQQELAVNCGFENDIIWDLLHSRDADVMRKKINQLIPDQPKGQSRIENIRKAIFDSVWNQRKYTNRTSVSYIFYVMVTEDTDFNTVLESTKYSCHPIFRCKKCDKNSDTSNCCMIYVDETGRVYQNWNSFIKENVLPAGTMVVPRKGVYNFNSNNEVILNIYCTPRGTPEARAMNVAQTSSAVLGIGAACVPVAALALPVAAPVIAAAGIISLGVGAFTTITSAMNLSDRKKHGQSISLTNNEARASYIGVLGAAVGMAGAGATRAMGKMAAAGKATAGIEVMVNGLNISSIVLSGSGVANGVLDLILKYNDDDEISSLDILQLSASLVLFTHSVYNFQIASQIANNARDNTINSYRKTLSNAQRKMFNKMSKETVRIRGNVQGKMDIIRGVNEIPSRQYLNDLFKVNKNLNERNVRPSFGESGQNIVLNNEVPINPSELRQNLQNKLGPNILDQVTQPIPATHNSNTNTVQVNKASRLFYSSINGEKKVDVIYNPANEMGNDTGISVLQNLAIVLPNGVSIFLKTYGKVFLENIADGCKFQDVVLTIADNFVDDTVKFILKLAQEFIENENQNIQQILKLYIPTESVLYRILIHILKNYSKSCIEFIKLKGPEIKKGVKTYFLTLNPNNNYNKSTICPDCNGWITICSD